MVRFRELPDLEAVAATAIRNANITNLAARVYSSIPAQNAVFPLATVQRISGTPAVREALDAANLQIDVWGGSKSQARDIAARARVVLLELEGTAVTDPVNAYITAVEDALGLNWQPDPDTGRDRYLFGVLIYGH